MLKFNNYFLFEMSSVNGNLTGIDDDFIWVGEKILNTHIGLKFLMLKVDIAKKTHFQ